ncbi:MAG: biopolymer transporter ExbD [Bdellovibrionales bacterium CG12_big_fil_rev_8_21_14_0_65_38_15]|nr:MAG: biopolymer transporter ExbD [Bdellovibrionales bacterium CG22_combo_CG10-13_8_21_14_all_38_13]PIQ54111.1 MAG: biopolymer transporter ExbD [Bdellovibrionales bacterium CG12_big_fil_rev_8_21_14_0_65_38_15]PIR28788.1 MAG: biopolymer transporter ExbD [Bdellovibrionales bacterium CG11_big_fil_rev_8_21_14_0_20_38_13]
MKRRSREPLHFEMTPLIDVVFLLIIFFMVTSVFKKDELSLLLALPKAASGESLKANEKEFLKLELSAEELAVAGEKISLEELPSRLTSISDKAQPVEMRVDKDVRYERVITVLDSLKAAGLQNINLITEK